MRGVSRRGREARWLAALFLLSAWCAICWSLAGPARAESTAVGRDSTAPGRDTTATPREPAKTMQQILAEADSAIRARGGSKADEAELFLSWDAPWGRKRAHRTRTPACTDSTREDTLYLCLRTGRAFDRFVGFTSELRVHATGSDTLGPWWRMQRQGGANPGTLRVEWAAAQDWNGFPQPFAGTGQGHILMDSYRSLARLRMVYAVRMELGQRIAAEPVYVLARIILRHHPERKLADCGKPVVIEWAEATLALGPKDEPKVARGERFVTYGGPYELSAPYRGPKPKAWQPGRTSVK